MWRRGLQTLDELDNIEEEERQKKEDAELREQQDQAATTASSSVVATEDPLADLMDFSGVASVLDPLTPSFWESLGAAGETPSEAPCS
jgi:hypothetical protein